MRYLRYLGVLAILLILPALHLHAQVRINVDIGPTYGIYHVPPPCPYGYYDYYPFECAPYGYWGPEYFANGVFIGAGPWFRFYYLHPALYARWYGPGFVRFPRYYGFRRFDRDDFEGRGFRHFDDEHRFRGDRDFRRFDHDDHGFRRFDRGEHQVRDHGWRGDAGFRREGGRHEQAFARGGHESHGEGRGHEGHGHEREHDHGGHGRG